tara:strand:+ start:1474 stop:2538 length:1065 start_codon:yes stop_codon:yes gene_type:complete
MRVCIIGSGLSALTLAKALVNQKIFVDLIIPKTKSTINQTRTLGISKSNCEYFCKNIINIQNIIWKLKKIEIFTDNLKYEKILNFENKNDQLFSIIKNFKLYEILNKSLKNSKFCKRKKFDELDRYNLIINTELSNNLTKKYFSKKIIKKYESLAYTTIIKHNEITNNSATQIFTKIGPLAFLPISKHETSIVYSVNNKKNNSKKSIKNLIQKYNFKYKIKKIENINSFELKSLNLRSYYHNNILAFGDLLHRIHPLAGQGFNMTIRDIKILLNLIKNKKILGLPLDSSINRDFQNELKHKNFIFAEGIDFLYEFFNLEKKTNNILLSKFIQRLGKNFYINKFFTKIADRGILN